MRVVRVVGCKVGGWGSSGKGKSVGWKGRVRGVEG